MAGYRKSEASRTVAFRVPVDVHEQFTRYRARRWPGFTDSDVLRAMLERQLNSADELDAASTK